MNKTLYFAIPCAVVLMSGCAAPQTGDQVSPIPVVPQGFFQKTEKGSVWKSDDGGRTFSVQSTVDERNRIEKADVLSFAFHPTKQASLIIGTADNGIFKTENGGDSWTPIQFPPKRIYSFILDRRDPDRRMFASGVIENRGRIFRTDDDGANWTPIYTEPGQGTVISSLAQDPRNPDTLYAGTSAGTLVKSLDAGETWKNIGNSVDGVISEILFDPAESGIVYLLIFNREMRLSRDGGETWVDWNEEIGKELSVMSAEASRLQKEGNREASDAKRSEIAALREKRQEGRAPGRVLTLVVDMNRSGTLYVGSSSGLYRSTDFGKYWEKLDIIESAEEFAIRSVAVSPGNSDEIIFVSGQAFYRSEDAGKTWSVIPLSTDRPPAVIEYDPFDPHFLFLGLRKL